MLFRKLSLFLILGSALCFQPALTGKDLSDGQIYDQVRRKLANNPDVKGGALDVDVQNGVVVLRGRVKTNKQKAKAEQVARKVKGVKKVVNELQPDEK
jgi:hyperosmotically inducible periplasmic protein